MVDATLILGLTNDPEDIENTDPQEIEEQAVHEEQAVREEQAVVIATADITGDGDVTFVENTSLLNFPKQQNIHQINSPSCTSNAIATSSKCINNTSTSSASANITRLRTKLESLKTNTSTSNISTPISLGKKRMRYSSVKEATSYFQNVQEDQSKYLQTISENLQRIASATEAQNELLRDSMNLHDRTLDILSETIQNLTKRTLS
ncbi:uncharacterized protein [Temnothorax longispinosus]|uniref:uncharacterized protein n=1 Tax=Temnothorax longispinosus TaxID=300112 RepID=UPI003A9A448F